MLREIFIIALLRLSVVLCLSSGAPLSTCGHMTPRHEEILPQESPMPVNVTADLNVLGGTTLKITIRSTSEDFMFIGFLIRAVSEDEEFFGRFTADSPSRAIDCLGIISSAVTHSNALPKSEVNIEWKAPDVSVSTPFYFLLTVVQSFNTFWAKHIVHHNIVLPNLPPGVTPAPTTSSTPPPEIYEIYDGCEDRKTCFGMGSNCIQQRNCQVFAAVANENDQFIFELLSLVRQGNELYVALGLSDDQVMDQDSIVECEERGGAITAHSSWTNRPDLTSSREDIDEDIVQLLESRSIDGRIYCKVLRKTVSEVRGVTFDLENDEYYLLIASGRDLRANSIGEHGANRAYSDAKVSLKNPGIVGVGRGVSVMTAVHGSFMIVAWIGCTSVGIVIARYLKNSWRNRQISGKDPWFFWHVTCMFLTWALTLTAFIIIFVEIGAWRTSVHAILGCVVLFLVILQPIGAMFRPDPRADARPLFNWLHFAFGNITHILAILTIFNALPLPNAHLPSYTIYVLIGFVTFYVLMHILFTSVNLLGEMKMKARVGVDKSKDVPFQLIKKTLFGFFVLVTILVIIGLLILFIVISDF